MLSGMTYRTRPSFTAFLLELGLGLGLIAITLSAPGQELIEGGAQWLADSITDASQPASPVEP